MFSLAYVALIWLGVRITVGRFGSRIPMSVGIAPAVVLVPWALVEDVRFEVAGYVALIVFQVLLIAGLVSRLFRARSVGVHTLLAGASTYLLIGNTFTPVHMLVEILTKAIVGSSAYVWPQGAMETWQTMVYFSFATLTTLGFGDMTPQTPVAQSFTILEVVTGQVFLAVLIGRLVGLHIGRVGSRGPSE